MSPSKYLALDGASDYSNQEGCSLELFLDKERLNLKILKCAYFLLFVLLCSCSLLPSYHVPIASRLSSPLLFLPH